MDGEEISFSAIKRKMKIGGKIEFYGVFCDCVFRRNIYFIRVRIL